MIISNLTKEQTELVRSLVRMAIRSKERGLAKAKPHPGQDSKEFADIKAHLEERLQFYRETLTALRPVTDHYPSALERNNPYLDFSEADK